MSATGWAIKGPDGFLLYVTSRDTSDAAWTFWEEHSYPKSRRQVWMATGYRAVEVTITEVNVAQEVRDAITPRELAKRIEGGERYDIAAALRRLAHQKGGTVPTFGAPPKADAQQERSIPRCTDERPCINCFADNGPCLYKIPTPRTDAAVIDPDLGTVDRDTCERLEIELHHVLTNLPSQQERLDAARYRAKRRAAFKSHTMEQTAAKNIPQKYVEFCAAYDSAIDAAIGKGGESA